jgi:hypothetical protein
VNSSIPVGRGPLASLRIRHFNPLSVSTKGCSSAPSSIFCGSHLGARVQPATRARTENRDVAIKATARFLEVFIDEKRCARKTVIGYVNAQELTYAMVRQTASFVQYNIDR